jgi:acyl carrier protein
MGGLRRRRGGGMSGKVRFMASLAAYIERQLVPGTGVAVDADTRLFDDGLIDSLRILQLIAFVEHSTGQTIPEPAIVMKHFRSVRAIADSFWTGPDERDQPLP